MSWIVISTIRRKRRESSGSIKIGTLKSILRNVAAHHRMAVPEVLERLDL